MPIDEDLLQIASQRGVTPTASIQGLDEDLLDLTFKSSRLEAERRRSETMARARQQAEAAKDAPPITNPLIGLGRGFTDIYGGVRQALGLMDDEGQQEFERERQFYEAQPKRLGVSLAETLGPSASVMGAGLGAGMGARAAQGTGILNTPIAPIPALPGSIAGGAIAGGAQYIPPDLGQTRMANTLVGAGLGPLGLMAGRTAERGIRRSMAPGRTQEFLGNLGEGPVPPEVQVGLQRGIRSGLEPEDAFVSAQAGALPAQYPLSRGQSTGDTGLLRWEHEARHGVHGPVAESTVKQIDAEQAIAGAANRDAIRRAASGRQGPAVRGESMETLGPALQERNAALREEITEGYRAARDAGRGYAPAEGLRSYRNNLAKELTQEGFDVSDPALNNALRPLDRFLKMKGFKAANINQVEVLRKRLNKARQSVITSNPASAAAIGVATRRLDETMETMLDNGLLTGDRDVLDLYRQARALNKRHADVFSDERIVASLMSDDLSPEQKANLLFGAGRVSLKGDALRAIRKLKKEFGENSAVIRDIKDEAVMRLFYNQPTEGFSPQKLVTEFDEVITKGRGRTIFNELFARQEMNTIQQLRNVAKKATIDQTTFNASRTSYMMMGMVKNLVPGLGALKATPWIGELASNFRNLARAGAIRSASPRKRGGGISYGAGAGALAPELMEEVE